MDSFIKLLDARKRRSLLRGIPKRQKKLLEKLRAARKALKKGTKRVVRTHCRDMIVLPEFVGLTVAIHNGVNTTTMDLHFIRADDNYQFDSLTIMA